ncbi:MAG: DUF4230 domain-containing protein [Acidobacteriota bacterium]
MTETKVKEGRRRTFLWVIGATVIVACVSILALTWLASRLSLSQLNSTTVSHSVAVERVLKVAKLVSSETTLRDVIIYEDTWYGSTKRSLVVVTGKVLAGIDLDAGNSVQIDEKARRITISLPQPGILGIEITEMQTYDEQRGLWNPFNAADRDALFQRSREQLEKTSRELKITETARQSARELLESMFTSNGYTVEVVYQ